MMWSTYSPEDNKLRLYSTKRLDAEVYARVKEQGFRWAPKQELFVAPMWTPSREDLLIELCGEIGDEDTSLVERQEQRAERFEEYSDSRAEDARKAHENAHAIGARFEGGQPILVGHHSEKRARKDKERMDGAMRAAVKMWDTSQYWQDRAKGALRHAKYKERPDVRARRIKTLEAEQRKCQRSKDQAEKGLKVWTLLHDDNLCMIAKKKDGTPTTFAERAVHVAGHTNTASMGTYSDLVATPPRITPEVAQEQAIAMNTRAKAHSERWIAHYVNRIAYERAMLDEAGGTLSEQKGCETGGAVKCWASPRGGWSYIQKVNKVSVTVLDNWGNGGENFTRTIEFDKLAGIMTAQEVQEKRDAGLLYETDDKTGFILMDSKPAPKPEAEPAKAPDLAEGIDAMRDALKNGGVAVVVAPQLFPTPPDLARRMVELAEILPGERVLEPSAGTGAILSALDLSQFTEDPAHELVAVELNVNLANQLEKNFPIANVTNLDFLELQPHQIGRFNTILMNPPFAKGADIKHIRHAMQFLLPGGRLVAICANGPRQNEQLKPLAESWEDLPEGTFADQGTNVNTALLVIQGEAIEDATEAPGCEDEPEPLPAPQETPEEAPTREESPVLTLTSPEPVIERVHGGDQYRLFL